VSQLQNDWNQELQQDSDGNAKDCCNNNGYHVLNNDVTEKVDVVINESIGATNSGAFTFSLNGTKLSIRNEEDHKVSKSKRRRLITSVLDLKRIARLSEKDINALIRSTKRTKKAKKF
jgi:hypothetical protein